MSLLGGIGWNAGGGSRGEVMGTIQGDHGPIPHSPWAFWAEIDPDSFMK